MNRAAAALAERMRLFKKVALDAREVGGAFTIIDPSEFWAPADEAALALYDRAHARATGAQALPFEEAHHV